MGMGKIVPIGDTSPAEREICWLGMENRWEQRVVLTKSSAVALEPFSRSAQREGFTEVPHPDELRADRHKTPEARTNKETDGVLQVGIQIYRLWFRFLKLALELESLGVRELVTNQGRKFTADGGGAGSLKWKHRDTVPLLIHKDRYEGWDLDEVLSNSFDEWWKTHSHLFEGHPVQFFDASDDTDADSLFVRIPRSSKLEDVRRFITDKVQPKLTQKPRFVVSGYPRPDVVQNRYNALVLTYQGVSNKEICYGEKIYLRATDARSRDMTPGLEGRLKVAENKKTKKLLYSSTVSKQRNGGLYHLQEVMEGRFGDVPEKGIR